MSEEAKGTDAGPSPAQNAMTPEDRQVLALRELAKGRSVVRTARLAGVDRGTLFRWLRTPEFRARLNQWRADVAENTRNQLYGMASSAAQAINRAIADGDVKTAMAVLKQLQILGPAPERHNDPDTLARDDELARRRARLRLEAEDLEVTRLERLTAMERSCEGPIGERPEARPSDPQPESRRISDGA